MNTPIDVSGLKTFTRDLMNHVYFFKHDFSIKPQKDHHLTAVNYTDIQERKEDFLNALVNTVSSWVYNKALQQKIINEKVDDSNDWAYAGAFLTNEANRKFRPGHPQGQFGELLLFNFLQHFFDAVPLLRKQRITTNKNLERNGADAIHFNMKEGKNIFFLGESKCYESKYKFKDAFEASLVSIANTFNTIEKELDLYIYDDFVESQLVDVAKSYKKGTLKNVKFELVCIIIYEEHKKIKSRNEEQIKNEIFEIVHEKCISLGDNCFKDVEQLIDRINFIIFPVWALNQMLESFQKKVGS